MLLPNALFTSFTSLYEFLVLSSQRFPQISYPYFIRLWHTYFWHVDIKSWNPFAKCHECVQLRSMWLAAKSDEERAQAKQAQQRHRDQISYLRKRTDLRAKCAAEHPNLVGMLLMDGMDSNKTKVPSFK